VRVAAVLALLAAAACASSDDNTGATITPTGTGSSTVLPTIPPIEAWILYRDNQGNLAARDLQSGDLYKQTVDFNEQVIIQAKCNQVGDQIGYLIQNFSETFRRIAINGDNAPADFIQVSASVQGFAWSPDGSQIAIGEWDQTTKVATISVVDVATGEISELATADRLVAGLDWSPDGSTLAYYLQNLADGTAVIELRDVSNGEARQPIENMDFQWIDPAWTPDGESLVLAGLSPTASQLHIADASTGEITQLTQDPTIYRRGPQFAPDGSLIAFTGSIIAPQVSAVASSLHQFGIFMLNADGTGEFPITVDPRTNPGAGIDTYLDAFLLGWCSDGAWLDDLWALEKATQ